MRRCDLLFLRHSNIKIALRPEFLSHLLLFYVLAFHAHPSSAQVPAQPAAPVSARTIHGIVKSGNMPIPGATVSVANASTKDQVTPSTDVDGSSRLPLPADGSYTVKVQMAAFAANSQPVTLDATHQDVQTNFELVLLSRAREASTEQRRASAAGRGFQSLSLSQSAGQEGLSNSPSDVVPSGMPVPGI